MIGNTAHAASDMTTEDDVHVGFIIASPYQLFHFGAIRRHLKGRISVFVEVRDKDFGLSKQLIEEHLGPCRIRWVRNNLAGIDGQCDVIVCQTPAQTLKFFRKSLVVAQQYSLAKEQYQYGIWRSQADINLMYGPYSVSMVSRFSSAVATGNPLLDGHVPETGLLPLRPRSDERLRVLYMPTYGDLSDRDAVVRTLVEQGVDLSIKAHHADFEIVELAARHDLPIHLSDADPIQLIRASDLVVSDYSGAIYDALAMRTPVALVEGFNHASISATRLSTDDLSRSSVGGLAHPWTPGDPVLAAFESSRVLLSDDDVYRGFIDRFYVNFGSAGRACADELRALAADGPTLEFATRQVRDTTRRYIKQNRALRAKVSRLQRSSSGLKSLTRGLSDKPWPVKVKKTVRRSIQLLPGGDRAVRGFWSARDRLTGRAPAPAPIETRSEPTTPSDLSEVAFVRRQQMMQIVSEHLADSGVPHRASATAYQAYIAVHEEDLDALHQAIRSLDVGAEERVRLWMGTGASYSTVRDASKVSLSDLAAAESIVVGVPYANGYYKIQRTGGVEVLVLEERSGRLVSRRSRALKADWTRDFIDDPQHESPSATKELTVREADPLIDVVYTWVDSSDPEWMKDRAAWSGQSEIVMASAANDERYLDRDELKYSLRSLALYAPFVRNIYIVTHGHRPSWLVDDDDRIRVVPHSEIFPDPSVLPTFNSHAIEASLHRIPGLSENFIYFNDDVFLGRDAEPSDFLTMAGLIKSRFSPSSFVAEDEPAPDAIPTDWASYNAVKLMREEFGMVFDRKQKHVPHTMKKSMLEEMEARFPQVFEQTRASRFRDHGDYAIPSMLAHYYGIATHRAVEWENIPKEYAYADTGRIDFEVRLRQIIINDPLFICLNVTRHADLDFATQTQLLQRFLTERFPVPSPWEVQPPVTSG